MAHKEAKTAGRTLYLLMFAAAIYLLAGYLTFFAPGAGADFVSILVSIATAIVAVSLVRMWRERKGEPLQDERTIKANRMAMAYSWWFTYLVLAMLLLVSHFRPGTLNADSALGLLFFAIVASQIILQAYFMRRGDLE